VLAAAGVFAALPPAEAAAVRVRFTPPYGQPFPNLEWFGEAVIDDGNCASVGTVSNLFGTCAGQFSFISATVYLSDIANPGNVLGTLQFTGGQVLSVGRDSPAPPDWRQVVSTPFGTERGNIAQTLYDPDGQGVADPAQAYFSLVFIGGYAQLFWFQTDPGDFLRDPLTFPFVQWPNSTYYALCYAAGPGDHEVGGFLGIESNRCGLSSNVGGEGGRLSFEAATTAVPEPGSLALMLAAALGAIAATRRRTRVG
jgi:hypothetical protein